jgi:hypothetical protein
VKPNAGQRGHAVRDECEYARERGSVAERSSASISLIYRKQAPSRRQG